MFWILGRVFGSWEVFWILGSVLSIRATLHSRCFIVFNVHTFISYSILPFPGKRPYLPGKKAHRLNRTNDGESQPSNGLNKKNSFALAAYFLVHFKVVAARLSRFPTDAAICSHAAPGHIFDRLKVRAFKGSVQRSNGSKFHVNRAKLLNGSVLTKWPVKCLSRSKILLQVDLSCSTCFA